MGTVFSDSLSWKASMLFHSVHTKSERNSCVKKFKPWFFFHLHTSGQSQHEVGVNVGLPVSESYRHGQTPRPHNQTSERSWGGRGFPKLFHHPVSPFEEACWQLALGTVPPPGFYCVVYVGDIIAHLVPKIKKQHTVQITTSDFESHIIVLLLFM